MRTYWLVEELFKHDIKFNKIGGPDLLSDMDSEKKYNKQPSTSSLDLNKKRVPIIGPPLQNRIGCNCKTRCIYGRNSHENVMLGSQSCQYATSEIPSKYLCVCALSSSYSKTVRVPRSAPLITFRQ